MAGSNLPPGCSVSDLPGNEPEEPEECLSCGRPVARQLDSRVTIGLLDQSEMDAALEAFARRQYRCEACWNGLAARGVALCVECREPVAATLTVHGRCPVCMSLGANDTEPPVTDRELDPPEEVRAGNDVSEARYAASDFAYDAAREAGTL